jgi:hypothetical protein
MPSLEDLLDYEGPPSLGEIDRKTYHRLDIIVEYDKYLAAPDMLTIVCMADDWEKSWPARLIAAQEKIGDLATDLNYAHENTIAIGHELQAAQERARRVTWLETELEGLRRDLAQYRHQEAARRGTVAAEPSIGAYEVQHQRDCDTAKPPVCSLTGQMMSIGPCACAWCVKVRQAGTLKAKEWPATPYFETNSHIAPEAPIFRKLCQCDDCREMRAQTTNPYDEIEGH